ncbi:MAG: helix-turn-helix transcriptional regulator [Paludibacteraceae bacterium]|nr:helix-turn-helix transcriptional regulator [Paludibacteraceae bacterium]
MNFYTQEQMVDKHVGVKGTPAREEYDEQVELLLIGDAIRRTRQAQSLSQEQLGELVGVQKSQISRLENGKNLTLSSVAKLFKALNQKVTLDIPSIGRVALW